MCVIFKYKSYHLHIFIILQLINLYKYMCVCVCVYNHFFGLITPNTSVLLHCVIIPKII